MNRIAAVIEQPFSIESEVIHFFHLLEKKHRELIASPNKVRAIYTTNDRLNGSRYLEVNENILLAKYNTYNQELMMAIYPSIVINDKLLNKYGAPLGELKYSKLEQYILTENEGEIFWKKNFIEYTPKKLIAIWVSELLTLGNVRLN